MAIRYLSGINVDSNTLVVDSTNNRVGINTASPDYALDLGTSGTGNQIRARRIYANGTGTDSGFTLDSTLIYQGASNSFNITNPGSYPSVAFTINSSGNVGIGTTNPTNISGYIAQTLDGVNGSFIDYRQNGTALFRIGADTSRPFLYGMTNAPMDFYTNTNFAMRIDAAGNVGIGSSAPKTKLHISGGGIAAYHNNSTDGAQIYLGDGNFDNTSYWNSAPGIGAVYAPGTSVAGDLAFYVYTGAASSRTERMRIVTGGNVGIGTSIPTSKLDVWGDIAIANQSYYSAAYDWNFAQNASNGRLAISYYGSEKLNITDAGNVGIGTTSPGYKLDVNGTAIVRDNMYTAGALGIELTWTGNDINDSRIGRIRPISTPSQNPYAGGLAFDYYKYDGSAYNFFEGMRLNGSGNVGIGTTSPSVRLQVDNNTHNYIQVNSSVANVQTAINVTNSASTSRATLSWEDGTRGAYADLYSSTYLTFTTQSSEKMRITSAGNVGIGTTSPSQKLHVVGNILTGTDNFTAQNGGWFFNGNGSYTNGVFASSSSNNLTLRAPQLMSFEAGGAERMVISSAGALKLNAYGSGSNTGTATQRLAVDASGNVIEIPIGSGPVDGTGTANYVTKWSDADTITNSQIFDNGTNVGIGTASPVSLLNLNNGDAWINVTDTLRGLQFGYDGPTHGSYRAAVMGGAESYGGTDSGMLTFHTQSGYAVSAIPPERMRISGTGNVGIGTSVPARKLHVSEAGNGNIALFTNTTDADLNINLSSGVTMLTPSTGILAFGTSSTEKMRITSAGNVGIGTTNTDPLSLSRERNLAIVTTGTNAALTIVGGVAGRIDFGVGSTRTAGIYSDSSNYTEIFTTTALPLVFSTNSAEKMRITSGGNVGIGISNPQTILNVDKNFSAGSTQKDYLRLTASQPGAWFSNVGLQFRWNDYGNGVAWNLGSVEGIVDGWTNPNGGGALAFYTKSFSAYADAPTEKMRITSGGNVGIGTTTINERLDVEGNMVLRNSSTYSTSLIRDIIYRSSTASYGNQPIANLQFATVGNAQSEIRFITRSTPADYAQRMVINKIGNVGIGTASPGYKLTLAVASATDSDILLAGMTGVSNGFTVRRVSSSFVYSMLDGGLGINNANPTQALHVTGNARVTGAFIDSNNEAGTSGQVLTSTGSGTDWVTPATTTAASLYDLLPAARVAYNWTGQVVNDTWTDIFSAADNVLTTGTWMVQMYISDFAVGGGHYTYTYTGTMQWYQAGVNQAGEVAASEIYLHRMGHAANASALYLRTTETAAAGGNIGKFQIKGNYSNTSNTTINFKFVKIF